MKKLLAISLLLISMISFGQNHKRAIDSLTARIKVEKEDTAEVNTLNKLSEELWQSDVYDTAMNYAIMAKSLAQKLEYQKGILGSFISIGRVYIATGAYPQALDNFFQSLKIAEVYQDTLGMFLSLTNIGTIYLQQQNYKSALEYYFELLRTRMERETVYNLIGTVYYLEGDYSLSMQYFIQALKEAHKKFNRSVTADIYNNIASVCEQRRNFNSALEWYFRALSIKEELNDKVSISGLMGGIGDVYFKQCKYSNALLYENRSLILAKETGNLVDIRETEKAISNIYEQMGNCIKAFEHHKKYIEMKDSILNKENIRKTTQSAMNYEFDKKQVIAKANQDKIDAIKEQELKQQRIQKYVFIGGLILVLVFSFFQYRSSKATKKAKRIIEVQKKEVELKNHEIIDSINYTKRLQDAILPPIKFIRECFPESFLYSSAKDIVAGDFYFMEKDKDGNVCFAVSDSTGHGIPGAMVSMVCSKALYQSVKEFGITRPGEILDKSVELILQTFQKSESTIKDGMDSSVGSISGNILTWAGANNPLWIIRNGEIIEYKGDSQPAGYCENRKHFTTHEIELIKGDILYLFTDGICDQFSDAKNKGKKFMKKRFRETLLSVCDKSMEEQHEIISNALQEWRGTEEQTDDQTILAIKI